MNTPNGPRPRVLSNSPVYQNGFISRSTDWTGLCWLLFVGVTVFMLCLPFMHSVFGLGDEGMILRGAESLLKGRRLYVDFFEFLPPGSFVIVAAWFGITGISIWSARLLAILTITGIACFTYLACRQATKHALSSALVAIGWAVMSQGLLTQISHQWFTTLFSMVAAWAALASIEKPQRQWKPLIAGISTGAAAMVTPTRGVLAMLAAATNFVDLRCHRANLVAYVLGTSLVPICLLAYVIAQGALAAAFDDVILFTARRYSSIAIVPFGYFVDNQNLPLKYLFPIAALLTFITCARNWRTSFQDPLFRSCLAFGLAGFVGCFPRPDMAHIAFAVPLVCPLLTYSMHHVVASWLPKYRYALAAAVTSLLIIPVIALSIHIHTALHGELASTPRGPVIFGNNNMRELVARIETTPPSQLYLFYPHMPMLPFLTDREQASKYDAFIPGYTTPSQYQEACIAAMRRASWLVIDLFSTSPSWLSLNYPALQSTDAPEAKRFELILHSGFEFVARDGPFELRRRSGTVDETVCALISE